MILIGGSRVQTNCEIKQRPWNIIKFNHRSEFINNNNNNNSNNSDNNRSSNNNNNSNNNNQGPDFDDVNIL